MIKRYAITALALFASTTATAQASIDAMKWQRRVLLVSSSSADDPLVAAQRHAFNTWQRGAAERDVSLVTVVGQHVEGAADGAPALRKRFHLDGKAFQAILIGKDGHIAMRSTRPLDGDTLQGTIDAMPMRQAGQR